MLRTRPRNDNPAVKVLSEKSHAEVLKMVDDFRKNQPAIDPNSAVSINLSNEFAEILSSDRMGWSIKLER